MECRLKTEQPRGGSLGQVGITARFAQGAARRSGNKPLRQLPRLLETSAAVVEVSTVSSSSPANVVSEQLKYDKILAQAGNSGSDPVRVLTMRPTGLRHLPPFTRCNACGQHVYSESHPAR